MYPSRRSHHRQSVTISMLLGQEYQICVETFRTLTHFLHIKITGLEGVSKFVGLHIKMHMVMWFCIAKCVAHRPINKQKLNRIHFCCNSLRKHLSQVSEYLILSRFLLGSISVSLGSLSVFACFTLGVRSVQSWFSLGSLLVFVFLVQMILFSFINILCHTALHDSMIHVLPFQSWGDFKSQVLPRTWGVQLFKRNRISFLLKNIPPCTWESLWGKL